MAIEEFLDFPRRDVLAAADDHVFQTADDVAVALLVDDRQIAAVHPAACVDGIARALGIIPVTAHHVIAASQKFAGEVPRGVTRPCVSTIFTCTCG